MRYVGYASESHNEKAFCKCIEQELNNLGIEFERQELGPEVITDGWNILARLPGRPGNMPLLFVFHLDTVAPGNAIEPYIEDGCIRSRGSSVLGADGKLAIAVVLESIGKLKDKGGIKRPLEMLFTVCQEEGLHGAKYADYSRIESQEAIVIDHYVTGEVLSKTPNVVSLGVELIGRSAHVITDKDSGINALKAAVEIIHRMEIGRISDDLNINVSDLVALSPRNIVPRYARFDVEVRAFGGELLEASLGNVKSVIDCVARESGCKYNINETINTMETDFGANQDMMERLKSIYRMSDIEMKPTRSFGYLDATCTNNLGIRTVPIGISIYNTHSAGEYVVVDEVDRMCRLVENILRHF